MSIFATMSRGGIAVTAFVAAALVLAPALPAGAFSNVEQGDVMPSFSLEDVSGATVSSADMAGKAAVVVFFREGPSTAKALKRVNRSYEPNKDKAVNYYGIYLGKKGAEGARALAEEGGAAFTMLVGTEEVYAAFGVKALPATAFFDAGSKLVHAVNLAPFDLESETNEYVLVALGEKTAQEAEMILRPQEAAPLSADEAKAQKLYGVAMVLMDRDSRTRPWPSSGRSSNWTPASATPTSSSAMSTSRTARSMMPSVNSPTLSSAIPTATTPSSASAWPTPRKAKATRPWSTSRAPLP